MKLPSFNTTALGVCIGVMAAVSAVPALAAQDSTANKINAGFYELGQDLQTLLNGSGGFLVIILGLLIGIIAWVMGRGPTAIFSAIGVTLILGYGVTALTGLSGVTAGIDMVPTQSAASVLPSAQSLPHSLN